LLNLKNSRVDRVKFRGRDYLIKRDDLLEPFFSGNKARKLYSLFKADLKGVKEVISFGGVQSNAMLSILSFSKIKGLKFKYFVKKVPKYLKNNPVGNYGEMVKAKDIAEIIETDTFPTQDEFKSKSVIFINQGGKDTKSEEGIKLLAEEIDSLNIEDLSIFLPSGIGATALYLAKHSKHKVYTTPCVGDSKYLLSQFKELEREEYPITILDLEKKYHFGKLYKEFFKIHQELKETTGIEFDMLYDPKGWLVLDRFKDKIESENIIYIHCGGVLGNDSMLERYRFKFGL
jgi:1-aminocyclopropane-1-carboxylate deaminase/D-cysteine desulfhydrase-like pyridoxal-dependent ACC family enzyme